ncbi:DUF5133 domain-containing protein [Streptomyces sp. NPDC045470]|uniref:DUF5133 domain-containing protein n=1 Tax=unclassified Streptomyces TaxID=2593676 RepID=UPI00340F66C5
MLLAHPAVLRDLVEQYETLRVLNAADGSPEVRQRMDDVAYTLCVSTGTRDVDTALIAARHRLPGARVQDDSVLSAAPAPGDAVAPIATAEAGSGTALPAA